MYDIYIIHTIHTIHYSYKVFFLHFCYILGRQGIFVEETASSNFVASNTCRRNREGIAVYSNVVGPVSNNFIVGNAVTDNQVSGVSAGGTNTDSDQTKISQENVFLANHGANNGQGMYPKKGKDAVKGDYWVSTSDDVYTADGNEGMWYMPPSGAGVNKMVSMFQPDYDVAGK